MMGPSIAEPPEDAEEFLEKVDEVHRLIEGLKAGTISPEYIDTKQKHKEQKELERLALVTQKCPAGRGPPKPAGSEAAPSHQNDEGDDKNGEAERRERAMAKVKELMANRERKLRARARYEEYVGTQDKSRFGTDYTKWDIWCPEDEEDDLINSVGPNTPQFKAMEKDIDERHRQMVERRQLAERCRVHGNEAYKSRQYSEALRCYQQGLESERTNIALHANAAMAALKMSCFVQAIEHCDKVLSIADFFHNNQRDPLCVKALQRRAEAYRALQQYGRAVQDLQAALELEPGNAEAEKQLARARLEDGEARKQRAIAKAVSKAAAGGGVGGGVTAAAASGGRGTSVEAVGFVLDLEKLGRLERLAASLAPAAAEAAPCSSNGNKDSGGDAAEAAVAEAESTSSRGGTSEPSTSSQERQQQQSTSAKRGPTLPPRRQGKCALKAADAPGPAGALAATASTASTASTMADICSELREMLRDDDACCVYFRECGGLQHVAARLITAARTAPGAKAAAAAAATGAAPAAAADVAPLLMLLNDACMNDGNLKQLPTLKVLPAAVAALSTAADETVAGAAVTLLCTAVTTEEVRREVSRLLGAGRGLAALLGLMATAKPMVQGVALALLGNCMVDKPTKAAMAAEWRRNSVQTGQSPSSAGFASGFSGPSGPDGAAGCFLALLRSRTAVLAEKAAVLLGNMATDTALRADILAAHGGVVKQLASMACGAGGGAGDLDLQRAAATALYNLTVDAAGQRLVGEDADALRQLYATTVAVPDSPRADRALAARAAGVCARAAKSAAGCTALLRLGALGGMLRVTTAALDSLEGGDGEDRDALLALLDAAVRILTLLTTPDDGSLAAQLVDGGGIALLMRTVRFASAAAAAAKKPAGAGTVGGGSGAGLVDSVLANAVLCLGGVARRREQLDALRAADPVPDLVGVAYEGRGNAASRNAAIALARLAAEPALLERLRELHGIEIIYQYVKP